MSEPIIVVDSNEVRDGKAQDLERAMNSLAAFVDANEPQVIAYNMYLNDDRTRMTVVQVHPDSASMEYHMKVAASEFAQFVDLVRLVAMDVYGAPSDELMALLRQKVRMLGGAAFNVHDHHAGFTRVQVGGNA